MSRTFHQVLVVPKQTVRPIKSFPTRPHGGGTLGFYSEEIRLRGLANTPIHKIQRDRLGIDALQISVHHDVTVALW